MKIEYKGSPKILLTLGETLIGSTVRIADGCHKGKICLVASKSSDSNQSAVVLLDHSFDIIYLPFHTCVKVIESTLTLNVEGS